MVRSSLLWASAVVSCSAFVTEPTFTRSTALWSTSTLEGRVIDGALKPTNNFILVKKADAIEKTDGGIILAGKSKIAKTEGVVLSVGPGRVHQESGLNYPMPVGVGDGVVYGKYDGTEIEYNGDACTLIRDTDVLVKYANNEFTLDKTDVTEDSVLVRVNKAEEETTAGGLLIASTSSSKSKKPSTGTVVKVGPGRMAANGDLMAMDVQLDDMVKFRDFAGNEVTVEDQEFAVVRMTDILAKF